MAATPTQGDKSGINWSATYVQSAIRTPALNASAICVSMLVDLLERNGAAMRRCRARRRRSSGAPGVTLEMGAFHPPVKHQNRRLIADRSDQAGEGAADERESEGLEVADGVHRVLQKAVWAG